MTDLLKEVAKEHDILEESLDRALKPDKAYIPHGISKRPSIWLRKKPIHKGTNEKAYRVCGKSRQFLFGGDEDHGYTST